MIEQHKWGSDCNFQRNWTYTFLKYGSTPASFFTFHCKAFYSNELQTGHSIQTFQHWWQVGFALPAFLNSWERILGRFHCGLFVLQDGEITIIMQTIEDTTIFLAKLPNLNLHLTSGYETSLQNGGLATWMKKSSDSKFEYISIDLRLDIFCSKLSHSDTNHFLSELEELIWSCTKWYRLAAT